jgi:hypothetical protein
VFNRFQNLLIVFACAASKGKMMAGTYGVNPQQALLLSPSKTKNKSTANGNPCKDGEEGHYAAWVETKAIAGYGSERQKNLSSHFDVQTLTESVLMGGVLYAVMISTGRKGTDNF